VFLYVMLPGCPLVMQPVTQLVIPAGLADSHEFRIVDQAAGWPRVGRHVPVTRAPVHAAPDIVGPLKRANAADYQCLAETGSNGGDYEVIKSAIPPIPCGRRPLRQFPGPPSAIYRHCDDKLSAWWEAIAALNSPRK
jgi:hypothetical protein